MPFTTPPPAPPPESEWRFIDALKAPFWSRIGWEPREVASGEVGFATGVGIVESFPDPSGALETVHRDFREFLAAAGVAHDGPYEIRTERVEMDVAESWRLKVTDECCRVGAADTEGIRRAIHFIQDETLRRQGPFLPRGTIERKPFVKTRISRCFFGPIKRPPRNRDELTDDVDYYPENYLNRLAHEGINGLWLSVAFKDLCPSRFFPKHGRDRERRLEKLRGTVEKCARFGIKIFPFCIEPLGFGDYPACPGLLLPKDELKNHPYFAGHDVGDWAYFCTSSLEGQAYLRECSQYLFAEVPGLGGMISINLGERATHCYSAMDNFFDNNCPRCSQRQPWEVFADTTSALADGMRAAAPDAEMISWLYAPQLPSDGPSAEKAQHVLRQIAAHTPENVTFQYNFESAAKVEQLGEKRVANDYWLSWPGPSDIFAECAENAIINGARASAKIQVGCSHEVATVPFVPVPGNLYRKYKAMRELGVETVMQCWYFGNYPGLMNKAAGELAFEPFFDDEDAFLLHLAKIDWSEHAPEIVKAWKRFRDAYANFPINVMFTHYGPIHHAIAWPLRLIPVDQPIAPSWKFTFPLESGDRIGECVCYDHTLDEILFLLEKMSSQWKEGVAIMENLAPEFESNRERTLDIGLAKALSLQIDSAFNVFKFHAIREELPFLRRDRQGAELEAMRQLVFREIDNSHELAELCDRDSRLGFHSEAEGYKYHAAKLRWRIDRLRETLKNEFPNVKRQIEQGRPLFADYTGVKPTGKTYHCRLNGNPANWEALTGEPTRFQASDNGDVLSVTVECESRGTPAKRDEKIVLEVEPRRLWPVRKFVVTNNGSAVSSGVKSRRRDHWLVETETTPSGWLAKFAIPWECFKGFHEAGRPLRINVLRENGEKTLAHWIAKTPWEPRLSLGDDNPENLGWLFPVNERQKEISSSTSRH